MLIDIVAFAILSLFVLLGALRGGVAGLMGVVTLLLSYVTGIWAAHSLGGSVAQALDVSQLVGPAITGVAVFLATATSLGLVGKHLRRWAGGLRGDSRMGIVNRWLGGFFGLIRGGMVVILVSWLAIWLDAVPGIRDSTTARVTERVVEKAVRAAMGRDDTRVDVVAQLLSKPGTAVESLQGILSDPRIEALRRDPSFWSLVESGAYARAMDRPAFREIAGSPELRKRFVSVGVVPPEAARDASAFRQHFERVLSEEGPKLRGVVSVPGVLAPAADSEAVSHLEPSPPLGSRALGGA